jgi:hypothetical protein
MWPLFHKESNLKAVITIYIFYTQKLVSVSTIACVWIKANIRQSLHKFELRILLVVASANVI